eukprot:COSAG04_NODE_632_length_11728_cov_15.952532_2_plen_175_part_00
MATAGASEHPFGTNESRPATGTSPQAWTRGVGDSAQQPAALPVTYNNQIDIKTGLKDGSLSSDEAIVLMEEQMEAKMREMTAAAQLGVASGDTVSVQSSQSSSPLTFQVGGEDQLTETRAPGTSRKAVVQQQSGFGLPPYVTASSHLPFLSWFSCSSHPGYRGLARPGAATMIL